MKRALTLLGIVAGGILTGGGAAVTVAQLRPAGQAAVAPEEQGPLQFVDAGAVLVPLVFEDGQLAGYVSMEVQLQVDAGDAEAVTARLPLLLHAINLQTYRTPLAAGPDGQLPNLEAFRRVVAIAATEAFGQSKVRRVAITGTRPA